MATLADTLAAGRLVQDHHPWPRAVADEAAWQGAAGEMAAGYWTLLGLWGEAGAVHMAVLDGGAIGVLSLDCADGRFPSVGARHAPAIRLERAARDLFGLEPVGAVDARPWLDHGVWGLRRPMAAQPGPDEGRVAYPFLPVIGENLHQVPVGPVHASIIEPGHFRFTADGETVVRLEQRLGYTHKGIENLLAGATIERAARLAGRASGDSTVAYASGFARAVEAALGLAPPPRAVWLRAIMAELERISNHLGDVGAICNDASFVIMHMQCGMLRERVLRAAAACFGHRLMMDAVVPGGVAVGLEAAGIARIRTLLDDIGGRLPALIRLYDTTASLQDRVVATGTLRPDLARRFGCGGFVGRASGRDFDARRMPGYAPYDALEFEIPTRSEGDVNARVWNRITEIEQSMRLIRQMLDRLPEGELRTALPTGGGEAMSLTEGFRGDVLVWLRIGSDGTIHRCHLRDPSWFQWPVLEVVADGNIIADFPICNKSFNCSYSGHDL